MIEKRREKRLSSHRDSRQCVYILTCMHDVRGEQEALQTAEEPPSPARPLSSSSSSSCLTHTSSSSALFLLHNFFSENFRKPKLCSCEFRAFFTVFPLLSSLLSSRSALSIFSGFLFSRKSSPADMQEEKALSASPSSSSFFYILTFQLNFEKNIALRKAPPT